MMTAGRTVSLNTDPQTLTVGETVTCRIALGEQVVSFESTVRYVDTGGLFIERPSGIGDRLLPGTELLIRYVRPDSVYQFLTVILAQEVNGDESDEPDAPIDYRMLPLKLRFPSRITRYQRRAYDRSKVEGIVKYRSEDRNIRTYRGYILDLSAGGVRFATRQIGFIEKGRNPVGMHIKISLLLTKGIEFNDIESEIRRVTLDKENIQDDYLIVQAAFHNLDKKERDKLDTWVKRLGRDWAAG